MKYKVYELIERLSRFPPDLEISTELAIMMTYPGEIYHKYKDLPENILDMIACASAENLCIFEGNWDDGVESISNLNGDFEKYCKTRKEINDETTV